MLVDAKTDKKLDKTENPKGTITINEALIVLKGKSDLSKMGLRIAAVRDGFRSRYVGKGKESFLLDEVKFNKWIKDTIDAIPENYVLISKASRELGITSSYVYLLVKKHKIKTKKLGPGKGLEYIDFGILQNVFNERKSKRK